VIDIAFADRMMLTHVVANLRAIDRAELEACEADLQHLPREIMSRRIFAFCACCFDAGPIAAWGMLHCRSGVGAAFAFGTDQWGRALLPIVRQIKQFAEPYAREIGYHRIEARALAWREDVARFMQLIGAQPEGLMRGFGCNGEDFVSYRWLANEHRSERRAARALHTHTAH
jgi:RimJ/RimL family protein N-acetyltransferase